MTPPVGWEERRQIIDRLICCLCVTTMSDTEQGYRLKRRFLSIVPPGAFLFNRGSGLSKRESWRLKPRLDGLRATKSAFAD